MHGQSMTDQSHSRRQWASVARSESRNALDQRASQKHRSCECECDSRCPLQYRNVWTDGSAERAPLDKISSVVTY